MAMTPRLRSAGLSESSLFSAPRSLNEAVNCRFSNLRNTSQPARRDRVRLWRNGVRSTAPAMRPAAARTSCAETIRAMLLQRLPRGLFGDRRDLWRARTVELDCGRHVACEPDHQLQAITRQLLRCRQLFHRDARLLLDLDELADQVFFLERHWRFDLSWPHHSKSPGVVPAQRCAKSLKFL